MITDKTTKRFYFLPQIQENRKKIMDFTFFHERDRINKSGKNSYQKVILAFNAYNNADICLSKMYTLH